MNKKLIPVVVIVLLLAAGGYYLYSKQSKSNSMPQSAVQTQNEAKEFALALESGKPAICTMSKDGDTMEYFIKGKMMKINTTSTTKDGNGVIVTTSGHMINDTKYLYTWDDKTKQGSKMVIPTEEENKAMADQVKDYQADSKVPSLSTEADFETYKNEGYTLNCKSGNVDDALFVPPSDIKFIDPTEMMKAIPSPDANGQYDMSKLQELQKQFESEGTGSDGL